MVGSYGKSEESGRDSAGHHRSPLRAFRGWRTEAASAPTPTASATACRTARREGAPNHAGPDGFALHCTCVRVSSHDPDRPPCIPGCCSGILRPLCVYPGPGLRGCDHARRFRPWMDLLLRFPRRGPGAGVHLGQGILRHGRAKGRERRQGLRRISRRSAAAVAVADHRREAAPPPPRTGWSRP